MNRKTSSVYSAIQSGKEKSGGLGLLAYMSNSDDEVSKPPSPVISKQVLVDDVCNKFLMDINNSTSKSKKKKKLKKVLAVAEEHKQKKETEQSGVKDKSAKVVDLGPWKELTDESTKYLYYWNIETNEVSWTLPECLSKSTLPADEKSAQKVEIKLKSDKIENKMEEKVTDKQEDEGPPLKKIKHAESGKDMGSSNFTSEDLDRTTFFSSFKEKRLRLIKDKEQRALHAHKT